MIQENQNFELVNVTFPHIGKAILVFWGHPEFYEYMEGLQQEKEGKLRVGFPPKILTALFDLTSEHDKMFPEMAPKKPDFWVTNDAVR